MAKLTIESFLNMVKLSGLVPKDRLQSLLQGFKQRGVDLDDSRAVAAALIESDAVTDWQADKLLQGKHRGFFLGKYRLLSLLGKGGMSSVYLAEHVMMRRRCAVKVLPSRRVKDSSYLGRFYREAQAVAKLDHPNIVRAYDVDKEVEKESEIHFLVMEFVRGKSLQELVAESGTFDCVIAAEFVRQAAEGLAHAHDAGLVHRDIKPGNLLIDESNTVKILDLGLARFFHDDEEESLTVAHDERVLGTADYLAPEQALDSHSVDHRADIYSLGCTMYFMLTGNPPFTEGTLAQRLMAHQTRKPKPIEEHREGVPADLLAIIGKLMEKQADARYQTGTEAAEALGQWLVENGGDEWRRKNPVVMSRSRSSAEFPAVPSDVGGPTSDAPATTDSNASAAATAVVAEHSVDTDDAPEPGLADFLAGLGDASSPSAPVAPSAKSDANVAVQPAPAAPASDSVPVARAVEASSSGSVPVARAVAVPQSSEAVAVAEPVAVAPPVATSSAPSSSPLRAKTKKSRGGDNRKLLFGIIGGAAALILGVVLVIFLTRGGKAKGVADDDKTSQPDGDTGKGSTGSGGVPAQLTVGPTGEHKTINAALTKLKAVLTEAAKNDVRDYPKQINVKVAGGKTYTERIAIADDLAGLTSDADIRLVISSEGSQPAVLAPTGSDPVIRLKNAKIVTIEGFSLRADGRKTAVEVEGYSSGTQLKNLTIGGFTETGVLATNAQGFAGGNQTEVSFERLKLRTANAAAVGMRLRQRSARLNVVGCRFIGPMQAGLLLEGEAAHTSITQSVFAQLGDGIRINGGTELQHLSVTNNTFHKLKRGIVFVKLPADRSEELAITRNVFSESATADIVVSLTKFDQTKFQRMFGSTLNAQNSTGGNWTSRSDAPAAAAIFLKGNRGKTFEFISTDPGKDGFLMPKSTAAHKAAGANSAG